MKLRKRDAGGKGKVTRKMRARTGPTTAQVKEMPEAKEELTRKMRAKTRKRSRSHLASDLLYRLWRN